MPDYRRAGAAHVRYKRVGPLEGLRDYLPAGGGWAGRIEKGGIR